MNVYEAFLAVKDGKIIQYKGRESIYFIFQTVESFLNHKRITKIELMDCGMPEKCPTSFEGLDSEEIEEVCLGCFSEKSLFSVVTMEEALKLISNQWKKEN